MDNVSTNNDFTYSECSFSDLLVKHTVGVKKETRAYKRWTDEDNKKLESMYKQGVSLDDIGAFFGKSPNTIGKRITHLNIKRCKALSVEQESFLIKHYWLLGAKGCAKKLNRSQSAIAYYARLLQLKIPTRDQYDPPIYRKLLPYDMAKRICILERKSPTSSNRIEDSVVILYNKYRQNQPMAAFHLDELCLALDRHFGRRDGVTAGALTHGWKR